MTNPNVWIVMVNWNLKEVTLECLESLFGMQFTDFQIVVVDNGSSDDSQEVIKSRYPQIHQVKIPVNRGSTFGYNTGFRYALKAGAEYIFLISNDTIIAPDALDHLLAHCHETNVGIAGPLIFYAGAPQKIWSAGANRSRLNLDLVGDHGRNQIFTTAVDRDFLTACAMLIKREVFEKVGLMDEDFFLYHEELDYCYRVTQAGFRLVLVPQAKLWHKVSLTSGGGWSPTVSYWMAHNSIIYYRKHARWWQWLFIIPWRLGSGIKTSALLIFNNRWQNLSEYWRGIWNGFRKPLRKGHLGFDANS